MRRPTTCRAAHRHDGWTPERQLDFLEMLARTGSVTRSARAAGMSRESAHRLRLREPDGLFAVAWDRALAPGPLRALRKREVDESHIRMFGAAPATEGKSAPHQRARPSTS